MLRVRLLPGLLFLLPPGPANVPAPVPAMAPPPARDLGALPASEVRVALRFDAPLLEAGSNDPRVRILLAGDRVLVLSLDLSGLDGPFLLEAEALLGGKGGETPCPLPLAGRVDPGLPATRASPLLDEADLVLAGLATDPRASRAARHALLTRWQREGRLDAALGALAEEAEENVRLALEAEVASGPRPDPVLARQRLEALRRREPGDLSWTQRLANLHRREGALDALLALHRARAEEGPEPEERMAGALAWASLVIEMGEREAMEADLRATLARLPGDATPALLLGLLLRRTAPEAEEGDRLLATVAAREPDLPGLIDDAIRWHGERGDTAGLRELCRLAGPVTREPDRLDRLARTFLQGPGLDLEATRASFRAETTDDPGLLAWQCALLLFSGRAAEAVPVCERIVALRPDDRFHTTRLAYLYETIGRPDRSVTFLEEVAARSPGSAAVLYHEIAERLRRLGRHVDALAWDERSVRAETPVRAILLQRVGDDARGVGQHALALRLYEEVLPRTHLRSSRERVLLRIAEAALALGDRGRGEGILEDLARDATSLVLRATAARRLADSRSGR